MQRRNFVKASVAGVGGLVGAGLPRLVALASTASPITLSLQAPSTLGFHSPLPLTATATYADGAPVLSGVVAFWTLDQSVVAHAPIVNGVAQTTMILGSRLRLGTLTVRAQVEGGGLGTTAHATAQIQIVQAPSLTIAAATVDVDYGVTGFTASATFTYPDGTPVGQGKAGFSIAYGAVGVVPVDILNGAASALLVARSGLIPAGTRPYWVIAFESPLYASFSIATGSLNVRK
jgi:hypothetical protein